MSDHPVFAVVGHPNKGKSSVVAALTQNDEVQISPLSGTTRVAQRFTLRLDERVVFELVDTPGFQRAARCLAWLRAEEVSADRRPARTRAFVEQFNGGESFADEVALLRPIVQGAGIVYVVDGSLPYSPEYETEMEILRWSGQPRLALINPIGGDHYVEQWQQALNQYFSLVRVFDPLHAGFEQHLQLLRTFGQLDPARVEAFDRAIDELKGYRQQKLEQGARIIVDTLHRLLTYRQEPGLLPEVVGGVVEGDEMVRFNDRLNRIEREGQRALEALFLYHRLEPEIARLEVRRSALMDHEQWADWGLSRSRLTVVGAGAGTALGIAADVGTGGASVLLGAVGGGVVGGLSGWLGGRGGKGWLRERLPDWLPGGEREGIGPVGDPNFAFVILGRTLAHTAAMLHRSHADRGSFRLGNEELGRMQGLELKTQLRLLKLCRRLIREGPQGRAGRKLREWLLEQLEAHL
ncbi:DUF3482 domain-containing protein [Endothiovibrio diazotrophicus]